jgi:IclR family transcriptional regulator, acetate operon repressor
VSVVPRSDYRDAVAPSARSDDGPVVQSVDRAIEVMEILARDGWSGVSELARELDIHKSTVFRLLSTLERRGIVEQHEGTQKYRLGFAVARLAAAVRGPLDLAEAGRDACERLSLESDETVNLAVLEGRSVVNIHQVNLSNSRVSVDWLGSHTSLHGTSSGKVLLAHQPRERRARLLPRTLEPFTDRTITDRGALFAELDAVAERGYATTSGELEEGLNAIAAPVRGADGTVVACVSVSGPSYRLDAERQRATVPLVVTAGERISRRLGYLGRSVDDTDHVA